ncbi:MAG: FtsX-like permease family protein [Myxococcales bacterium]|nr:FtsX-like permease family protein [Myxococcales bacterium]
MMLLKIAWRNLLRNSGRTLLTVLGAACALLTFVMLRTVVSSWNSGAEYAAKDRLGTRHKVSFVIQLPKKYVDDIRAVPGVKQATWANWFGARDPRQPNEFFANMAVDAPSFLEVMDELVLPDDQKKAWLEDKKGAIVGDALAKKLGVKVGDKITLEGSIYPGDWEFNIRGIYTASRRSLDRSQFLFHWSYMNDSLPEARRDEIGWVMIRVSNVAQSAQIAQSIDRVFEERDTQTVTMSERQLQASFMAMFSALLKALDIVSVIILAIMMMVLGNTIAMGVRERTREYGVLRAIGFSPWHIRSFVLGEAAVLGLFAGVAGIGLAYPVVDRGLGQWLEENMGGWFPYFRVEPSTMVTTVVIAIGLSALASLLPVLQAGRISVTDALRRVG